MAHVILCNAFAVKSLEGSRGSVDIFQDQPGHAGDHMDLHAIPCPRSFAMFSLWISLMPFWLRHVEGIKSHRLQKSSQIAAKRRIHSFKN